MSCALVCHSWVRAAKANLLRDPHATNIRMFTSNHLLVHFHTALTNFPHLIHHIRRLSIAVDGTNRRAISQNTLQKICGLPFTHLDSVSALIRRRLYDHFPLQQLLSSPTLVDLELDILLEDIGFFPAVWQRCSPALRNLTLSVSLDYDDYE